MKQVLVLLLIFGQIHLPQTYAAERQTGEESVVEEPGDDASGTSNPNTVVSPGFKIHVNCAADSKLNGDFRVSADGQLSLPYNVSVRAANIKLKDLERNLEKTYQQYFKSQPRISLSIKQRRYWVRIQGVVKSPGAYLLKERSTLDEALAMASVKTEDLPNGYVRINQGNRWRWIAMEDYLKGGAVHDLPAWQGGEQILFQMERPESESNAEADTMTPSGRKIQVLGEVKNPGGVSFQRHADGYYYLIQRGGPTHDSDLGSVEIIRKDPKLNEYKRVSLSDISAVKNIQESDVMLIRPDVRSSFERGLQNMGLIATIVSAIALTVFVARR